MISITDKHNCCGCGSCQQICPVSCITMKSDVEGFCYPETDTDKCINCNLCEKSCPVIGPVVKKEPENSYYSYSLIEDIRKKASSGGLFQTIADWVIDSGGIVFGARFDKQWNVIHDYSDKSEVVTAFCGSKYLQSRIGDCYKLAKAFLEDAKTVLFSGTPCQIHGLKRFLKKEYKNLITIDFVCHGVPSPAIWQSYLDFTAKKSGIDINRISSINFRDKSTGWKNYSLTIKDYQKCIASTSFRQDSYMQLFLRNYILRPSCYNCKFKDGTNVSDITLGDFWGVSDVLPEIDDNKGLSIVLANTSKGTDILSEIKSIVINPLALQDCIYRNPSYNSSSSEPVDRNTFWNSFYQKEYLGALSFLKSIQPSAFSLMKHRIKTFLRSLLNK